MSPIPAPRSARRHCLLVCLDRSPQSEVCLPYALALAKAFGSKLTLLHVMAPPRESARPQGTDALDWEISRQEARAYLERIREQLGAGDGVVELRLEQGRPVERIIDVARELGADLTVLASHGDGATPRNLGSTAQQLLAGAGNSVFIAHAGLASASVALPRRILVPLDGSLRTESALATAARLAASLGAELLLVHVVAEPQLSSVLQTEEGLELARRLAQHLEASALAYLQRLREQLQAEGAAARTLVLRHPNDRQCLLEVAQREHVDLIVLSAHGIAYDPGRSFGGVAADLLSRSTVSLLALQDMPEPEAQRSSRRDGALAPLRVRESVEGA